MAHRGRAQRVDRRPPPLPAVRNRVDIVGVGNTVMNFEGGQPYVNVGAAQEILAQESNDRWSYETFSNDVTGFINALSSTTGSVRYSVEHRVRKEYLPKFLLNMRRDSLKRFPECRRILTEMSSQDKIPSIAKASLKLLIELVLSDPIKNETAEKLLTHEEIFRSSLDARRFEQQDQIEQELRVKAYALLLSCINLHCCKATLSPSSDRFRQPLTRVREDLKTIRGDTHALTSAVFFALEAISRLIDSDEKKSKALLTKLSKFLTFIEEEAKKQDPLTDKLMKKVTKFVNSVTSYDEELALIFLSVLTRTTPGGLVCFQLLAECRVHRIETERRRLSFKRTTQHEPSWSVLYRIAWHMVRLAKDVDTPRATRVQAVKADSTMCLGSFWTNPDLKKINDFPTAKPLIMAMCEDLIYSDIHEIAEAVTEPLLVRGGSIDYGKLTERVLPKHLAHYHQNEDLEVFQDQLPHQCNNSVIYQGVMGGKQIHVAIKVARVQNLQSFNGLHDTSTPACKRIQDEIKVLRRLKHPNIINLLASSVESPVHYVMGLMTHGNLMDYLRKHRSPVLPPQQLFAIAIHVLRALAFLQGDKSVHRNVMAKNVLVTMEDGVLCYKLSGFCKARKAKESKPYAVKDSLTYFKGSWNEQMPLRFLAPESLVSQWYSAKSDMWSFGVFLYELFTCGAVPYQEFDCMSTEDLLFRIVRKGLRMKQPSCVPTSIFRLMKDLLRVDELERPAADLVLEQIEQLQPKYSNTDDDWRPYLPPVEDVVDAYCCQEIPEALLKRLKDPDASSSDRTSMAGNALQECYEDLLLNSPDRPKETVHKEETLTLEKVPKALASVETYREIGPTTKDCEQLTAIRFMKDPVRSGEEFACLYTVRPSAGNLRDYLSNKCCSSPSLLEDFCRAITLALQCLHGKDVVHRDLRLEHVFVENEDGQPKVMLGRFGRTKKLLQGPYDEDVSESYFEYGRPGPVDASRWSPPEVLHFGLYSFKSDVFSLGSVFQELWQAFDAPIGAPSHLTVPYQGMKAEEIRDFLDRNMVLEKSPSCPDWLFQLIQKCRAYHNVDRPTLEDILQVLETHEVPGEWKEDPYMFDYYALVQLFDRESFSDDSDPDLYEEVATNKRKEDGGATCTSPEPLYMNLPLSGQQGTTDNQDADSDEEDGASGGEDGVLQASAIWAEQPVQMRTIVTSLSVPSETLESAYHPLFAGRTPPDKCVVQPGSDFKGVAPLEHTAIKVFKMAADMRLGDLPPPWRYAVTRDSRIYFINDDNMSTSWLHPLTGQPVQTGYRDRKDLPSGWEEAVTPEGAPYFVDHRGKKTTFKHPVTGQSPTGPRDYILMDRSTITDSRSTSTVSFQDEKKPNSASNKSPMDVGILGGTLKETKKEPPSPSSYLMRGWLNKQDHGGLRSWRKRWFVLTNRGLLYYKNEGESNLLGSIVLIGYKVEAISASADKSRSSQKHAFKLTHPSQRQYIFSAESREDMVKWLKALNAVTTTDTQTNSEICCFNSTNNVPSPKQNIQRGRADEIDDAGFNERDNTLRPRVVSSSSQEGNMPTSSKLSAPNGYQPNYRSPQYQENRQNSPNYVQYRPKGDRNGHAAPRPVTYHAGMAMTNNVPGSKPSSVDTDSGYHGSERRPVQNSRSDSRLLPYANDLRNPYRTDRARQQPPDPRVVQRSESLQRLQQWKSQTLERQGRSRSDLSTVEEVPRANYRNYQQDNGSSSNYSTEHRKGVYPDSYKTLPRHMPAGQISPKYNSTPPSEDSWHISTLPRNNSSGYKTAQDQYYQNYARNQAWQHNTPADPKELKREESLRQLSDWRQRTLSSTTSQGSGPSSGPDQSRNYQDMRRRDPTDAARKVRPVSEHFRFPETRSVDAVMRQTRPVSSFYPTAGVESPPPVRPPLPTAYRHQEYGTDHPDAAPSRSYRTATQEAPKVSHVSYNHVPETKETSDDAYSLGDIDDVFAGEVTPSSRPNFKLTSSDLMGKSHEELTLLLIQLKRDQDQLVEEHNDALSKMMAYTRAGASGLHSPHDEEERWKQYEELRRKCEESERKLNASKPMLSLVTNMVKLGDLYNTPDNRHNKQYDEFGRRTNPEMSNREQFEFSRQLEEQQVGSANSGLQHSPSDDKLVNVKSMRIRELDGHMQELTARVTVLKEDMENLERTLHSTSKKMAHYRDQPQEKDRYASLQAAIQSEISKVRADLAQESKKLEAFSGEHGQLSNELRAVHSRLWEDSTSTTASSPSKASEKAAMKNRLQQDLAHVQSMMSGLAQQRDRLEGHVNSIRNQFSAGADGPFVETDLDTGIQHDLRAAQQAEREHQNNTQAREEAQLQRSVPTILVHRPENNADPSQNSGAFKSSLSVRQLKRESAERRSRDRQHDREVVGGEADGNDRSRSPPKRSNTLPGRPRDQSINNMTARSLKRVSRSSSDVSRLRIPSTSSSEKTKPRPDFSAPVEPFHSTTDLEMSPPENSPKVIETDIEPVEFDLDWNRELLPPAKTVLIPERYVSDTESEESLSPEEQAQRRRKAAKFQKLLSNYSMQDLSKANSEREKKDRAHILSVQAALASQVKQESRKMARSPHLERKTFTVPEDRGTYL
ncbi:PLEKHA5 [Branchiostoma lanceolatum]|uniref:PLEKHA5 protein n=1 Tax=Branchiostoma lanceolatum TaxID=7740 RepID=A0A8J9ZM94_BRALA|nr:PLEKHA5 [Branchiostoma lanceolatum]